MTFVPALLLALAIAGCGEEKKIREEVNRQTACKVVEEDLNVEQIEERFGEADKNEDFFGDTILTYEGANEQWKFQVSARVGAFRALRQPRDGIEEILPCRN